MRIDGIDHIYIICCGKFKQRKEYIENAMNVFNFDKDYYTLTMNDPVLNFSENSYWETLTHDIINEYYNTDPNVRKDELIITKQDKYAPEKVSLVDIAVSINHMLVWKDIVKKGYQNTLILEDDIIFFKDSFQKLNNILNVLPSDYDFISLEDGAKMHATMYGHTITPDKLLYHIECGRMRCTGSYLISNKACKKIINLHSKRKWTLEIDHIVDLYGALGLVKVYWAEPVVFTQGSQCGIYRSGVQTKSIKKITCDDLK